MPFPFIDVVTPTTTTEWAPPKEFLWDITTKQFIVRNGCIPIVEGLEALRIWIYKCLFTARGRFDAYTWDFGTDLEYLVTSGFTREAITSESKRMIKEALTINKHISGVSNFKVDFSDNKLNIEFTVTTDCGDLDITI